MLVILAMGTPEQIGEARRSPHSSNQASKGEQLSITPILGNQTSDLGLKCCMPHSQYQESNQSQQSAEDYCEPQRTHLGMYWLVYVYTTEPELLRYIPGSCADCSQ